MTYKEIVKDIRAGNYSPIYILTGDESYFIDKIAGAVEENVLDEEERSFNLSILYGLQTDVDEIMNQARRFPVMAEHQVVIVREAQQLRSITALESYAKAPQPSTVLVLCFKNKKPNGNTNFVKLVKKKYIYFEAARLKTHQVPVWIETEVRRRGMTITSKAAILLQEFLGDDLGRIEGEIVKLSALLGPGGNIDDGTVEKYIGISKDYNNFELSNAVGERNFEKSVRLAWHFASNSKEYPLPVSIKVLYNLFSRFIIIHSLKKRDPGSVARATKLPPFLAGLYGKMAGNYSLRECVEAIRLLREYDGKSKGLNNVSANEGDLLKELTFRLLRKQDSVQVVQ